MEYTVRHVLKKHDIQGTLIAKVSTDSPLKDRWTEIYVYRVDPGGAPGIDTLKDGGYLSHVIGQSLRAHTLEIRCDVKGGAKTAISMLPDDAVPCPDCRPSFPYIPLGTPSRDLPREGDRVFREREGNDSLVRLEIEHHRIHPAATAEGIIAGLTEGKATIPGEDAIMQAAEADPGIRDVLIRRGVLDVA